MHECDVIVVGSGLVGAAAALSLAKAGLQVCLVGAERPSSQPPQGWDPRIYALSPGSTDLLGGVGAWPVLDPARVQPVSGMIVSGDRPNAEIEFDALETGVEALAYIVESRAVLAALWSGLEANAAVRVRVPERPRSMVMRDHAVDVTLESGDTVRAKLVVGADGAGSWVRHTTGIPLRERRYPQEAIVANFEISRGHGGIARQWFRRDGVLAMLPLPGALASMVWSVTDSAVDGIFELDTGQLAERVAEATDGCLGALRCVGAPARFPLRAMNARRYAQPRVVLVGDAAHNVHPLAGQGVNLGFRDVRDLAAVLGGRGAEPDCGSLALLRRYERSRREDVLTMIAVTDGLQRLFSTRWPGAEWARNAGLALTGRIAPLRRALATHAIV